MRRVVVTGTGVVSPIGSGMDAFRASIRAGTPGVGAIQSFDAHSFPTRIAAEVKDVCLEAVELPASWRPALLRDRKSIFGLLAAREAIAEAFGPKRPADYHAPRRIGLSCATGLEIFHLDDLVANWAASSLDYGRAWRAAAAAPVHSMLQIPSDLGARAIATEAGAAGLLSVNVSACAAGTQALGEALFALRDGVADCMIAGGYDSMINPLGVGGFCMLEAMSRRNDLIGAASRPFDARRDGFVLGEGAGFCVLEELGCARRRGARILAEVFGYGSTLDAYRVSDPAPDQRGAIGCIRAALADGRVDAAEVGYINAHGTATRKNDPAETAAIKAVFGERAYRIPVSSTKSQIGHLIGAAGAVEFLAALMPMLEGLAPATINLECADPECDLDYVPREPRRVEADVVLSNSFGFGGQNAAIVAGSVAAGDRIAARQGGGEAES